MLFNNVQLKTSALLLPSFQSNPIKYSPASSKGRSDSVEINTKIDSFDEHALDRSAKRLHEKMLNQTYAVNEVNINSIINRVFLQTGAPKEDIQKALMKLTQFSSYSQLNALSKEMIKHEINSVRSSKEILPNAQEFSLGGVLKYLHKQKEQFSFSKDFSAQKGLFLDNMLLDRLEEVKDTKEGAEYINKIKEEIKNGCTKLVAFDGWNAVIDGQDVSHGLFGSSVSLKDSLNLVIEKAQNENLSIDEILNQETINKAKAIFGEDVDVEIIKNEEAINDYSIENIVKTMAPNLPDELEIKAAANVLIDRAGYNNEMERLKAVRALFKYFDYMLTCYSSETLTQELQAKYSDIKNFIQSKGKTIDDVYYIIPNANKSFNLINYQFLKANNISPDKIICLNGVEDYKDIVHDYDCKALVILDDILGSGKSMATQEFKYQEFADICAENFADINLIFSPLVSLKSGVHYIDDLIKYNERNWKDTMLTNNVVDYAAFVQSLSSDEREILSGLIGNIGFCEGGACTAMPYMIPDNSSEAAGYLLHKTLNNGKSHKANKPLSQTYEQDWKEFLENFKQKIQEYKQKAA